VGKNGQYGDNLPEWYYAPRAPNLTCDEQIEILTRMLSRATDESVKRDIEVVIEKIRSRDAHFAE
jgi:hypothetical protein